jgi:flagellar motor protein MotB
MNPVLFKLIIPADSFSKKEYELTKDAKDEIKKCAAQIKKLSYRKITVEGHCDSFETQYEAKKSSRLRAKAVYDELIENGINPDKTQYVGLADKIREETNKTKKGRLAIRRTEIFVEL